MKRDMTQGSITKALVLFTVPLVLSGLLQQIFNWVDAFIVGNIEGEAALAGIGATTSIYGLFITILTGFTAGLSVLSAQQYGSGEREKLTQSLATFSVLLGGACLVTAAAGSVFYREVLTLLGTPEDIFEMAGDYLKIIFLGVPFLAVYNTYSAVLRGMGDSRAPFLSILVSSLANIVLDVLFVASLRWGSAGAAAATVISQSIMTIFIVVYAVKKHPALRFRLSRRFIQKSALTAGGRFGLPPAIQSGMGAIGNLILQRFMNGFGGQTVAAITTAYRVDSVVMLPIFNFGSGIATVVAQNIGAGNRERAEKAFKTGVALMAGISLCLMVVVLLAGGPLIAMFGLTQESVDIGKSFFRAVSVFYIVCGVATAVRGYVEGMGDMVFSGLAGIAALVVRIIASYAFAGLMGNMVIAYAEAFSWVVLLLLYFIRLRQKRRETSPVLWK